MWGNFREIYPGFMVLWSGLPFFNLILVWNSGVSFSLFANNAELGRWILVIASSAVVGFLFYLLRSERSRMGSLGFALVIAGAIGNIFDRVRYGAVVDFLDFHAFGWHWPAFNMADMLIVLGVFLLIIRKDPVKLSNKKENSHG